MSNLACLSGILLFMTACVTNDPAEKLSHELDSLLSAEFGGDEPGGSVLVKKGEKTAFLHSYGLADLETKEKITENTLFNIGSISKTFVSNGILILQENGLLSVEDSLSKYFSDFKNNEIADRVRLKHILSHTSGLPDNRNVDENFEFFLSAKDEENFAPVKKADSLNSAQPISMTLRHDCLRDFFFKEEKLLHTALLFWAVGEVR